CATTPANCAAASTNSTPGKMGWFGKCPRKKGSSPRMVYSPVPDFPGSSASKRSRKRNSGPCGRWRSAAARSGDVTWLPVFQRLDDFVIRFNFWREHFGGNLGIQDRLDEII